MSSTGDKIGKISIVVFFVIFLYELGYRQRNHELTVRAKARASRLCKEWSDKKGTYTEKTNDGSIIYPPIRYCMDEWKCRECTMGFETNPITKKLITQKPFYWFD